MDADACARFLFGILIAAGHIALFLAVAVRSPDLSREGHGG